MQLVGERDRGEALGGRRRERGERTAQQVVETRLGLHLLHEAVDELERGLRVRDAREIGGAPVGDHVHLGQEVEVAPVLAIEHDVHHRERLETRAEAALRAARALRHPAHEPELAAVEHRDAARGQSRRSRGHRAGSLS